MSTSVYTLLVVESPVMARIIQKVCPPSVYVLATGGFCWRPSYDSQKNELKAKADPEKRKLRSELKEQARLANRVVIAADQDPSGDFIAWAAARFLKRPDIQWGRLQSISRQGIFSMLSEVQQIDFSRLEYRLKNRFLIRDEWEKSNQVNMELAGLTAVFGASNEYQHFLDDGGKLYKSSGLFRCAQDEWIPVQPGQNKNHIPVYKPLALYDLFSPAMEKKIAGTYQEIQLLVQQLFQTILQFSEVSLISYPRTSARAFYSETWETISSQYMKIGPVSELKPRFLQEVADPDLPHESIHPLNLGHSPEQIKGELPKTTGQLYEWIYNHTIRCVTLPAPLEASYTNELNPGVYFYDAEKHDKPNRAPTSLHPCITLSDLGTAMNRLGTGRPSSFGKKLDEWSKKKWVRIEGEIVKPGTEILKYLNDAESYERILTELGKMSEYENLTAETVRDLLTS